LTIGPGFNDSGGNGLLSATIPFAKDAIKLLVGSSTVVTGSLMAAASQKSLADQTGPSTTAPMEVRDRSAEAIIRGNCVTRGLQRAQRQQIIGGRQR
jgi:hypothetical protein